MVLALAGYHLGILWGQQHLQTDTAQQQLARLEQALADTQVRRDQQFERWQEGESALEAIPRYERAAASKTRQPVESTSPTTTTLGETEEGEVCEQL